MHCLKPWDTVFIDEQGRTAPCCEYRPAGHHGSIGEYLASDSLTMIKQQLGQGQWAQGCSACAQREQQGGRSLRQQHLSKTQFKDQIQFVELSLDSHCNMSCTICSPGNSTGVSQEHVALGWIKEPVKHRNHDCVEQLEQLPGHVRVTVTGGEPFMSQALVDLLKLVRRRKWSLSMSTNCSLIVPEALDLIKDIDDVSFQISVDAMGSLYGFVRWPSTWDNFLTTLNCYRSAVTRPRFTSIHFNTVVTPFNLHQVQNLAQWARSQRAAIRFDNIIWPSWHTWAILTPAERASMSTGLDHIDRHIASWQYDPNLRRKFVQKISAIAEHRGANLDELLAHYPKLQQELVDHKF